jgi:hypothetical protein
MFARLSLEFMSQFALGVAQIISQAIVLLGSVFFISALMLIQLIHL